MYYLYIKRKMFLNFYQKIKKLNLKHLNQHNKPYGVKKQKKQFKIMFLNIFLEKCYIKNIILKKKLC